MNALRIIDIPSGVGAARRGASLGRDGLEIAAAEALVRAFMADPRRCCLEVSEINPRRDDRGNAMAEAAWQVIAAGLRGFQSRARQRPGAASAVSVTASTTPSR